MKFFLAIALTALAVLANGERIRYDGYKVQRITPQTPQQLESLKQLENLGASFWSEPTVVGKSVDVMFPPHLQGELMTSLRDVGMKVESFVEDVEALVQATYKRARPTKDVRYDRNQYNSLAEIYLFLDEQAASSNGQAVVETFGTTFEGRDLKVIRISKDGGNTKPCIFIDANIHAREWITNAVALRVVEALLGGRLSSALDRYDFHIVPVLNPDGYEFTRNSDRLWRKTRSTTTSPLGCRGADPNRNYGFHWLEGGSSTNPCSDTYAGSAAFSEVENQALRDYITSISSRLVSYISLHSYSQLILLPYGHVSDEIPQYAEYMRIGNAVADAIQQKFGKVFTPGNIVDLLYVASGGSMDWVKGTFNTNLTYTFELRDTGSFGFLLPANQIDPSAEEFIDGFEVILAELDKGVIPPPAVKAPAVQVQPTQFETFGHAPAKRGLSPLEALRRN